MFGNRIKPSVIAQYLDTIGVAANVITTERWRDYLTSLGFNGHDMYEQESQWLSQYGFTGTFADMFNSKFGSEDSARSFFTDMNSVKTNIVRNPDMVGTGSLANLYNPYQSGTTLVGTRSVASGVTTITATQLTGGNRRYGMSSANGFFVTTPKQGDVIYFRATVDLTGLAPGTNASLYADILEGATYNGAISATTTNTGVTLLQGTHTVAPGRNFTTIQPFVWINSLSADWTGTSTIKVSQFMVTVLPNGVTTYPYFSGNTPNTPSTKYRWLGIANASQSQELK